MKKALILFECSRTVADSFEDRGVEAWSMDILKNDHKRHIQKNVYDLNLKDLVKFDFIGAHPPCTYLTFANTGGNVPWCNKTGHKRIDTDISIYRFIALYSLMKLSEKPGYIENPPFNPYVSKFIQYSKFHISGHNFGSNRGKIFQLFTFHLPPLIYTKYNYDRIYHSSFSSRDKKKRNSFPKELAEEMVNQWLKYI